VAFFLLHPALTLISRLALGTLFTFSGGIKLFNLRGFRAIVIGYGFLPVKLARVLGTLHPFAELANGLVLLGLPLIADAAMRRVVAAIAAAHAGLLLFAATFFVIAAMAKRKKMSNCGCFGTAIKVPLGWHKVIENAIWAVLAFHLFLSSLAA
jgi:hypothetical protein